MMSPNVRRLVLDPTPWLQNGIGLGLWAMVGLITALWMSGGSLNVMMVFSASAVTLNYTLKTRAWQILPVSRAELGRTQWWYLWGRPVILLVLATALAWGVVTAGGWLKHDASSVLAFLGAEMTLVVLTGLAPVLTAILRRFGDAGYMAGIIVPFLSALMLGFRWTDRDTFMALQPEMMTGGVIAAVAVLALWPLSAWLPLALPKLPSQARAAFVQPSAVAADTRLTGWWALAAALSVRLGRVLAALLVLSVCVALVLRPGGFMPGLFKLALLLQLVPLIVAGLALVFLPMLSQRALAGLPVSAWTRTLVLHLAAALMQCPVFAAMLAVMALLQPDGLTADWLLGYGLTTLTASVMVALALPLALRFGQKGPAMLIALFSMPLGMSAALTASIGGHDRTLFGLDPGPMLLVVGTGSALLLVTGLIWTWAELAYGRAAYRYRPLYPLSWRGR